MNDSACPFGINPCPSCDSGYPHAEWTSTSYGPGIEYTPEQLADRAFQPSPTPSDTESVYAALYRARRKQAKP